MKQVQLSSGELRGIQATVAEKLSTLKGRKILIVGDIGLDEYVTGDVRRISPEAPVPVVEVNKAHEYRLGLAANVAHNVSSLGGQALLLSVSGQDEAARTLRTLLQNAGVATDQLFNDPQRPTTRKLRVMTGHHHIVRVDFELKQYLSENMAAQFDQRLDSLIGKADAIVVQDYAKGVINEERMKRIVSLAHQQGKKVIVDPYTTTPAQFYRGVDMMTPNRDEATHLSGLDFDDLRNHPDSILEVGRNLMDKLALKQLVITRGKEGMSLFYPDRVVHLPTYARQVFDVTGAGDTVVAALSLAWAAGLSLEEACVLANFAAGVVVAKPGCVPCKTDELIRYIQSHTLS